MGFRVDFFQLYSISKSTGTRCTTALLPDPVLRWLSVSVSSHHCWISSIISSRLQLTDEKTQQLTGTLTPMFCLVISSRLSTSGNISTNKAERNYYEISDRFPLRLNCGLSRWVINLPAGNDDEFWGTTSVNQLTTIVLGNCGPFSDFKHVVHYRFKWFSRVSRYLLWFL